MYVMFFFLCVYVCENICVGVLVCFCVCQGGAGRGNLKGGVRCVGRVWRMCAAECARRCM